MKKLIVITWIVGCGVDGFSTNYTIASHKVKEVLLTQSVKVNSLIIGGQCGMGAYGLDKLYDKHPKLAAILGIGLALLKVTTGTSNFNQFHKFNRMR